MKLKPYREKQPLSKAIKDIYSLAQDAAGVSVTIDVNGCVVIEDFRRIIEYNGDMIAVENRDKRVYLYGHNITVTSCSRYSATVCGEIEKIEIFSKEVK
ncbi:MAG: hypothetical protein IJO54_04725 [Oscillospiraceae bacterium]|nr:hypothetical protein [Oscillospiraceae bacterium]